MTMVAAVVTMVEEPVVVMTMVEAVMTTVEAVVVMTMVEAVVAEAVAVMTMVEAVVVTGTGAGRAAAAWDCARHPQPRGPSESAAHLAAGGPGHSKAERTAEAAVPASLSVVQPRCVCAGS